MDGWRMAAGPAQLPPQLSAVLLSDAALVVKKLSVSKNRVTYQILGILCEIPEGVFVSFNVCPHVVSPYPTCLGTRKVTSVGKPLCSPAKPL